MRLTLAILIALLVCTTAWAVGDAPWAGRPGTIKHALEQPNGTVVTLDCVHIGAIYKEPQKYMVIYDWYVAQPTLIVDVPATEDMRPGQVIDIVGTISSLSDGRRILICPTIFGYMDKENALLVNGGPMTKGTIRATEWPYKIELY